MFDLIQKAMYVGLGVASLTKEKLEELADEISKHADLSQEQAAKFQSEFKQRATQARADLESEIDHRLESMIKRLGLVKQEELHALQERITRLEQELADPTPAE